MILSRFSAICFDIHESFRCSWNWFGCGNILGGVLSKQLVWRITSNILIPRNQVLIRVLFAQKYQVFPRTYMQQAQIPHREKYIIILFTLRPIDHVKQEIPSEDNNGTTYRRKQQKIARPFGVSGTGHTVHHFYDTNMRCAR